MNPIVRHFILVVISVIIITKMNWMYLVPVAYSTKSHQYYTIIVGYNIDDNGSYKSVMGLCSLNDFFDSTSCHSIRHTYYIGYVCSVGLVTATAMRGFISDKISKLLTCFLSLVISMCIFVMLSISATLYEDAAVMIRSEAFVYGILMVLLLCLYNYIHLTDKSNNSSAPGPRGLPQMQPGPGAHEYE